MVESGGLMGKTQDAKENLQGMEKAAAKYCPIMTAGNVHQGPFPGQHRSQCMGVACGIWNKDTASCGLISFATRLKGG